MLEKLISLRENGEITSQELLSRLFQYVGKDPDRLKDALSELCKESKDEYRLTAMKLQSLANGLPAVYDE